MITNLPTKSYIFLLILHLLTFFTQTSGKSSDTPEITIDWSTTDNHAHQFKNFLQNNCSYTIRTTQPSYNNNQQPYNKNSYYNPYIAYMSVSDFQYVFGSISNKYDVLNNYSLYAYPNFRSFARDLPCYQEFMFALHNKIQTDKNFRAHTTYVPGFNRYEFHTFVRNEVNAIHQAQKTVTEKKRTLHVNNTHTLDALAHNCIQKINSTYSNNNHERLRNRLSAIEQTRNNNTSALDHQLHKELCHTRNTIHHLERTYSHDLHVQILAPVVYRYATEAQNEHCPLKAFALSDFCHTITQVLENGMHILYDASSAIGKGVLKGAHGFASIEHWKSMATGAMQLGLLFADAIGQEDALHYAMVLAVTTDNTEALTIAATQYCTYTQAQKDAINTCAHETYKKIKSMSWQEIVEHGTEIGTTLILDTLALNAINGFSRATSNLVIKELNSALESGALLTEQYAVEVAGFGKLIVEEGAEVSAKAADLIKNESMLFAKSTEPVAQNIKNTVTQAKWSENIIQKIRNIGDDILDIMEQAGGHTLERHVAQTYNDLIKRTAKKAVIQNASSFTNKRIAINAVKENLKHNAEKIALWLNDPLADQMILEFSHSYPIGNTVLKGKKNPFHNLKNSRMVLKKDVALECGFKILTAFPII